MKRGMEPFLVLNRTTSKSETLSVRFAGMSFNDGFEKEDMWFKLAKWQKLANEFELLTAPKRVVT